MSIIIIKKQNKILYQHQNTTSFMNQNFHFLDNPYRIEQYASCKEKKTTVDNLLEIGSTVDTISLLYDEAQHGCNNCKLTQKNHHQECPIAIFALAKYLRLNEQEDEAIDKMTHEMIRKSVRLGYIQAEPSLADDLCSGKGCNVNILKSFEIYSKHAGYKGNEDCARKLIRLAEENSFSQEEYVEHILRLANNGDEGMMIKFIQSIFSHNLSISDYKTILDNLIMCAKEKNLYNVLELAAEGYQQSDSNEEAFSLYQFLHYATQDKKYQALCEKAERKILQFDILTDEEIANKGWKLYFGWGSLQNYKLAYKYFEEAEKRGNRVGQRGIAYCYYYGKVVPKSLSRAKSKFIQASQSGDVISFYRLNLLRNADKIDIEEYLFDELQYIFMNQIATAPDSYDVNFILGMCYMNGHLDYTIDLKQAIHHFKIAEKGGYIQATRMIGLCYERRKDMFWPQEEALDYFRKGAEMGDIISLYHAGRYFLEGIATIPDKKKGYQYMQNAYSRGYKKAAFYIARCYEKGEGVSKDPELALDFYKESARLDNPDACQWVCRKYYEHEFKDYTKVVEYGEKALALGKEGVKFEVAYANDHIGNKERAKNLYMQLAENGNIAAMNNLGCLLNDSEEKAKWFLKAADSGDNVAQSNIAYYYLMGIGVEKDIVLALQYYEKSANSGYEVAMYKLGNIYKNGEFVECDGSKMKYWYERAISQGHIDAALSLALEYRKGNLIEEDTDKAIELFKKVADVSLVQKNKEVGYRQEDASYYLGEIYEENDDIHNAIFYYRKAASKDHHKAKASLVRFNTNWIDKDGNIVWEDK